MEPVELVILLTGLGGGTGTGAAHEFARQSKVVWCCSDCRCCNAV